ncbi:MAG: hypothetical protein AAFQ84_02230 [Pseudomonadota bacterium]
MGKPMTRPCVPFGKARTAPTPLLQHLAGAYAAEIARIWPAPHEGFLVLPAARRHVAALLVDAAGRPVSAEEAGRILETVTFARDKAVSADLLPAASISLMTLLGKLGERLWPPGDYAVLMGLARRHGLAKFLRHLETPDRMRLRLAASLPDELVHPRILGAISSKMHAEDFAEAMAAYVALEGEAALPDLLRALRQAKSPVAMMDRIGAALLPDAFAETVRRPKLPPPYEAVVTRKQLKATALAFQNCLRTYEGDLASGRTCVFVRRGLPEIVLSFDFEDRGWHLEEASLKGNKPVPADLLPVVVSELRANGIWVGTPLGVLAQRLHDHACPECNTPTHAPYPNWRGVLAGTAQRA